MKKSKPDPNLYLLIGLVFVFMHEDKHVSFSAATMNGSRCVGPWRIVHLWLHKESTTGKPQGHAVSNGAYRIRALLFQDKSTLRTMTDEDLSFHRASLCAECA